MDVNPARMVKRLPRESGERSAYIALSDVQAIADRVPEWLRPIIWTAFYSGMRRGEILGLRRQSVNLPRRIITLTPKETKEGHWKRVPIHAKLVLALEAAMRVTSLGTDRVFLLRDRKGVRPPHFESLKNPWRKACAAVGLDPRPRFHDLRHTWRANARRSRVDPAIAEAILGHWSREKPVHERYGMISDEELVEAIDSMTFDHGPTEIHVAGR